MILLKWIVLLIAVNMVVKVEGYPSYRDRIPNGYQVQDPKKPTSIWTSVGHTRNNAGGPRNPFGRDFSRNGYEWTQELCNQDSDGDGRTNGQELGDPECVWQVGKEPSRSIDITHPGLPNQRTEL